MAVSAAIALAGLGMAVYGAVQKDKAAKEAKKNVQPKYEIPQEEYDNLKMAENLASTGMSGASRAAFLNNADRGFTATTDAILKGGGDANSIGNAYERYNEGISNMSIYDDKMRMQHLQDLMGQRSRMAAFKDKSYQVNEYSPWANKAQALSAQMAGGQNTMMSGINTFVSGAGGFAQGMANKEQMPSYGWNKPEPQTVAPVAQTGNSLFNTNTAYSPKPVEEPTYEQFYGYERPEENTYSKWGKI
jgi:hypothetical protein